MKISKAIEMLAAIHNDYGDLNLSSVKTSEGLPHDNMEFFEVCNVIVQGDPKQPEIHEAVIVSNETVTTRTKKLHGVILGKNSFTE